MISYIMKKIIGSQNDREIKRLAALVDRVNEYESEFQSIPDSEFAVKTGEFRERIKNGLNGNSDPVVDDEHYGKLDDALLDVAELPPRKPVADERLGQGCGPLRLGYRGHSRCCRGIMSG